MTLKKITCTGKGNTDNNFVYSVEEGIHCEEVGDRGEEKEYTKWSFKVMMPNNINDSKWFDFEVTKVDDTIGKVTVMNHNNYSNFQGKGIPSTMIKEASEELDIKIISSSNEFPILENESRSDEATKVWKRLVTQKKARYNKEKDIYEFLNL